MKFIIGVIFGILVILFAFKYGYVSKDNVIKYQDEIKSIVDETEENLKDIGATPKDLIPKDKQLSCAIQMDNISSGDTVTSTINITGQIIPSSSCPWVKFEGQGGTVVAKDSLNIEISNKEILSIDGDWMNTDPFNFDVTLNLQSIPPSNIAYIYFQDDNQADSEESPSNIFIVPVFVE